MWGLIFPGAAILIVLLVYWRMPSYKSDRELSPIEILCAHLELVPVETASEPKPVAYICLECNEALNPVEPAVASWRRKERTRELKEKADREFSAMFSNPDARAEAIEEAGLRRAEIAAAAGARHLISQGGTNNIVNRDYGVFTTGYEPSEWDHVR